MLYVARTNNRDCLFVLLISLPVPAYANAYSLPVPAYANAHSLPVRALPRTQFFPFASLPFYLPASSNNLIQTLLPVRKNFYGLFADISVKVFNLLVLNAITRWSETDEFEKNKKRYEK